MAGTIWEFFGYRTDDPSAAASASVNQRACPFVGGVCEKRLHSEDDGPAGVCAIKPIRSGPVICCPIRLYADGYKVLRDVADLAFGPGLPLKPGANAVPFALEHRAPVVAVFGKRWGGELRVPKKAGLGGYWVDWVLALINPQGNLEEFVAVEVQTIDTTGNYKNGRAALIEGRGVVPTSAGFNWENVNKRILPQLIYKGQLLQREELCKKGLFFVAPQAVFNVMLDRVGGLERVPKYALQPAAITFLAYDYAEGMPTPGQLAPLARTTRHTTTVYKVQEAFNNVQLTDENVYRKAILEGLGLVGPPAPLD